ncbi:MAG: heme ABC transporter ATP-binding protein [Gemmatimonadaceae bacterium]
MVEGRGLEYHVNGITVLKGVDVQFRQNRFNVILGPNGAGKSTLLKIVTGLLQPSAGEVLYDAQPISAFTPAALAQKRAVLSQHVDLAFPVAAADVVLMGRYPHYGRTPMHRDRDIVAHALDLVGMTAKRAQPYSTLSGGERQKIQLARVLSQIWNDNNASEQKYLFLDEPTTSLDIHYQIHLLDIARDLLATNCTVIAVLHDINTALHYGDSFFVMEGGRVALATDQPTDITASLIERVFRVRARLVPDAIEGDGVWRFEL